ncbi:putative HMP/thiamine import ATP-binding protein YkoD [compost metagenome]
MRGGQPVIKVEELKVYPGDFIAVTGANGAGKSSLLLSLMGLLKISGNYLLQDQQMVDIKKRKTQIRTASQHIGFVFQNPEYQFIEETVSKEVAFSLREAGMPEAQLDHKVRNALERFGLLGFEARHPFQLSLGQKRRLSVAGAVVMEKSVLLLDEPTFGQDAVNTFEILTLCEELRVCGAAIIMVTHEEMIANHMATRRWEINGGTLRQSMTARGSELMPGSRTDAEQRIAGVMV